ncbi:MAG: H-X9-DG-CTERM domain-containing protein [Planctomycetota bacterium]|jgi:prepilin-type processing-associated H-X9-DG protein
MEETDGTVQRRKHQPDLLTILLVVSIVLLAVAILRSLRLIRLPHDMSRVVCGINVSGIAKSLMVYANDDEQMRLPAGDKWCDYLLGDDYTAPKQFICRESEAIEGESCYALNRYLAGKSLLDIPGDVVLLFETDFGIDPAGRTEPVKNRVSFDPNHFGDPNRLVYRYRWNQSGGPEILTTRYHYTKDYGGGCNVAFADAHVEYVKAADLPKLKFKSDPNEWDKVYNAYFLNRPKSR